MAQSDRMCGPTCTPVHGVRAESSDIPAFAVIPSPPNPFEAFVKMRQRLADQKGHLHVLAVYSRDRFEEAPRLLEGSKLLGTLLDKMDACIKDQTGWRKLDAIDIFSPTSNDPAILTFQGSLLNTCQRAIEQADCLRTEPSARAIFNLVPLQPARLQHVHVRYMLMHHCTGTDGFFRYLCPCKSTSVSVTRR